jgi:aminopeptidase N
MSEEVRSQDIYMPLAGLRNHVTGIEARWTWLKDNWDAIYKRLPPSLGMLGTVIQLSSSAFCTEAQLKEVEAFFGAKDTKVSFNNPNFSILTSKSSSNNSAGLRSCCLPELGRHPCQDQLAAA